MFDDAIVDKNLTLDKFYAQAMELVTRHWSGKHRPVVPGINLSSLLWTDGEVYLPCDLRVYDKRHGRLSRNDHFRVMVDHRGWRVSLSPGRLR